jgi:pyruvate/2-oxoglutarate/acetoin dehydrogenase E1 component
MREITFRQALNEALDEEMANNGRMVVLGEDVGLFGSVWKVTEGLYQKYGAHRVIDTPISESAIIGTALGAAACGCSAVAEIMFCDFMACAMDQIVNQAAKMRYMFGGQAKLPVVIRTTIGAGLSAAAQHSQSNEAYFMHTPGLKVVMPSSPYDAKGLLKSSIRDENPVIFYEHKSLFNVKGEVPAEEYTVALGQSKVERSGSDVTIVATMQMVPKSLKAADVVAKDGIDVEVIDLRTLVPLDQEAIMRSVLKTRRLVVAMEEVRTCGVAAEISAIVHEQAFDKLKAPVVRVCALDSPVPFNPRLEEYVIPQVSDIVEGVRMVVR